MSHSLGVDLGTTFAAAAVARNGRTEIFALGDRSAAVPSVVLVRADGPVLTGDAAHRRAPTDPDRVAREFKRRLGDPTPLVLGGVPYSAQALLGLQLRAVVDKVAQGEGAPPDRLVLTHPANWGPYKRELFDQVPNLAGLPPTGFVSEPEAAAVYYASNERVEDGAVVAVYDLGGGTFDATVLRKTGQGFEILGVPEGIEGLGGIDFDEAVFAHVNQSLDGAISELDRSDPAVAGALIRLRDECVLAKEALSADTETTIPVLLPALQTEVRLTRGELEQIVRPSIASTIESVRRALRSAQLEPSDLSTVLLVGGSSRIPIVSQMVSAELGRPTAVDAHPKFATALGAAAIAASGDSGAGAAGWGGPAKGDPSRAGGKVGPAAGVAGAVGAAGLAGAGMAAAGTGRGPGPVEPAAQLGVPGGPPGTGGWPAQGGPGGPGGPGTGQFGSPAGPGGPGTGQFGSGQAGGTPPYGAPASGGAPYRGAPPPSLGGNGGGDKGKRGGKRAALVGLAVAALFIAGGAAAIALAGGGGGGGGGSTAPPTTSEESVVDTPTEEITTEEEPDFSGGGNSTRTTHKNPTTKHTTTSESTTESEETTEEPTEDTETTEEQAP